MQAVAGTLGQTTDDDLIDACGSDPGQLCEWVFDASDSAGLATLADWFLDKPIRILLILALAWVLARVMRRSIDHLRDRLIADDRTRAIDELKRTPAGRFITDEEVDARSIARTETISSVLSSSVTMVIWVIAGLLVLGEVGISLAPLLAGAGIAGIAIGFGAQSIVRDFLAGFFMLVEDQYGVGDVIDVGEVAGTVESVSLRTTVLRDVNGVVWHVPNGEIARVGNKSQLWSRAVVDVEVSYDTDLRLAQGIIQRVANELWQDVSFTDGDIIEPPEVWGVEHLGADGIALRLVVKTDPAEQWVVARELRVRIKEAFDAAGIEIPFPQRTVWVQEAPPRAEPEPGARAVAPLRRRQGDEILPEDPGGR